MQEGDLPAGQQHMEGLGVQSGLKAEYKDDIRRPFLAAVTPAAKPTVCHPVAHHLLSAEVLASLYLLIPQTYLSLLKR